MCKIKFKVYLTKRNVLQLQAPDDTEIYKYQEKIENLTTKKKRDLIDICLTTKIMCKI